MKHTMLHMKLKMAVCSAALLAFLPTSAFGGVCFLPDCSDEDLAGGGGNMDLNEDTAFCESKGFPIMLPVNVRSIMLKLRNATVMNIILNVMLRLGVNKTDTTQPHVPL